MPETSYGTNDPQYIGDVGYRSGKVANVGSSAAGQVTQSYISYNGFGFPPTSQIQVTVVQEYDDPKRTVKYLTIALTVTCVVTSIDIDTTKYTNTDDIMDFIRTRLSQNGQPLEIVNQGLGNLKINTISAPDFMDVDYGPKPQVQEMKPIAGQRAIELIWLCTTRIPACSNIGTGQGIIQSHWNVSYDRGPENIATRTVRGKIEQSRIRPPNPPNPVGNNQTAQRQLHTVTADLANELARIYLKFPPIGGYKRSIAHQYNAGYSVLEYTITDVQYTAQFPLFPGVIDAQITQSMSSNFIPDGFRQWVVTFQGKLTVVNSLDERTSNHTLKKEAWAWLGQFIIERLLRAKGLKYDVKTGDKIAKGSDPGKGKNVVSIPISLAVTDNIYDNSFSFKVAYRLVTSTTVLFAATGMFDPADIPGLTWDRHKGRLTQLNPSVKDGAFLPSTIKDLPIPYIIDLCVGSNTETSPGKTDPTPKRGLDQMLDITPPDKEDSFMHHENNMEVDVDNPTIECRPLKDSEPQLESFPGLDTLKQIEDLFPNPPLKSGGDSAGAAPPVIIRHASPSYTVTMRGYAVRMGFKIDAPHLQEYGGRKAFKIHDNTVESKLAIGHLVTSGNQQRNTTIYRLDWEKTYRLDGPPFDNSRAGDAFSEAYA